MISGIKSNQRIMSYRFVIDPNFRPIYGEDNGRPMVKLFLQDTEYLTRQFDHVRTEHGFLPMIPPKDSRGEFDDEGWYFITAEVVSLPSGIDINVWAEVRSYGAEDDGTMYKLDMSVSDTLMVALTLNDQCVNLWDDNLVTMLKECKESL